MYGKLNNEREKARNLLQKSPCSFNLSDLRNDKTLYLDKTPARNHTQFDTKEISARSTIVNPPPHQMGHLDFDEIMRSSCSQAVRNKYRESMSMGRLSSLPKTADMSQRTTMSSHRPMDFWDEAQPSFSSFNGKNITFSNEDFRPAEEMADQMREDERAQQMEFATIPREKSIKEVSTWENASQLRQPELSFGQYCMDRIKTNDIRDVYGKASPQKRSNRVALVEISSNESGLKKKDDFSELLHCYKDVKELKEKVRKYKPCSSQNNNEKKTLYQEMVEYNMQHDSSPESPPPKAKSYKIPAKSKLELLSEKFKTLNTDQYEDEKRRLAAEKERTRLDIVPVKDDTIIANMSEESIKSQKEVSVKDQLQVPQNRGLKRRSSSVNSVETPKSTLDKCLRSKSPTMAKELRAAAAHLKPQILPDESLFKVPLPCSSTLKSSSGVSSLSKSPSQLHSRKIELSTTREYYTAKENFTLRSPDEKLSLPSYSLHRPPNSVLTSPSNSVRSGKWSPNGTGRLRRSASQLSNGSEFGDDFLPIKIKNLENRKLSFESVKIDREATRTLSIQNGCDKKLPLRVRVVGAGFSVSPREDFRMLPMEARTFHVTFSPSIVGPSRGFLIFELATNKNCSKTIHLFGYGGNANLSMEGVQKGPFGPHFVTMGCVKEMGFPLEKRIKLRNTGSLPAFLSVVFERTKLSDFAMLDSLTVEPTQARINPGDAVDVRIRFKATKTEIRKIFAMNKDVMIIGEICIICGDEPTRLRILQSKGVVHERFLSYLPKALPGEAEIKAKLLKFKEELTAEKLSAIMAQIKTHEVALTINRNLDDTQCISAEISLADDTQMSFETFVDTNATRINTHMITDFEQQQQLRMEFLESKYFRIHPSQVVYYRTLSKHPHTKCLYLTSTCDEELLIEAISSNSKLAVVSTNYGRLLKSGARTIIEVTLMKRAFETNESVKVIILIKDARVEIPIIITD